MVGHYMFIRKGVNDMALNKKQTARKIARERGIPFGANRNYFDLDSNQQSTLVNIGKAVGYRYGGKAGKSYGRAFYDYLNSGK